ncbi:MAG TPA: hypothetical protein VIM79_16315, partial [Niastella sp.]
CSSFAIICQGEVLYAGEPDKAVNEMEGKIFSKAIDKDKLPHYQSNFKVISTQLKTGRLHIRVLQDGEPGNGFVTATPTLEDVYFSNISTRVDVNTI